MSEAKDLSQRLHLWADELHAIANEGLHWDANNPYGVRRMERIRRIAAELSAIQNNLDADAIERMYRDHAMHVTPFSGGEAAVFNASGQILLIQRTDDQLWALPGGALEVGESPAQGSCREAWEETGLKVDPVALVGVYDSRFCGSRGRYHLYHFVFLCRPCDLEARPSVSSETLDVGWFAETELPPLSPGHAARVAGAFRYYRGELPGAVFDNVGID